MPYYHVRLFYYTERYPPKIKHIDRINLPKINVDKEIIEPYLRGEDFRLKDGYGEEFRFKDGYVFKPRDVAKIQIKETQRRVPEKWKIDEIDFVHGTDVTEKFMNRSREEKKSEKVVLSKNVFIVHGHDIKPVEELKRMLAGLGLNPIVLHEQPSGSRTIIEKLEQYSDVGYAFVILTSDDVGYTEEEFKSIIFLAIGAYGGHGLPSDEELNEMKNYRARQNVVLEFGYFMGLLGRDKVCCLLKGDVERPSDMQGIVYVPFKESIEECRDMIVKELRNVGYSILEVKSI